MTTVNAALLTDDGADDKSDARHQTHVPLQAGRVLSGSLHRHVTASKTQEKS